LCDAENYGADDGPDLVAVEAKPPAPRDRPRRPASGLWPREDRDLAQR